MFPIIEHSYCENCYISTIRCDGISITTTLDLTKPSELGLADKEIYESTIMRYHPSPRIIKTFQPPGPGFALTPITEPWAIASTLRKIDSDYFHKPETLDEMISAELPIPEGELIQGTDDIIIPEYHIVTRAFTKMIEMDGIIPVKTDLPRRREGEIWVLDLGSSGLDIFRGENLIKGLEESSKKGYEIKVNIGDLLPFTTRRCV